MEIKRLRIYSDGASSNNGGKNKDKRVLGSFCSLVVDENNEIVYKYVKCYEDVTNNFSEMMGAIYPLNKLINEVYKDTTEKVVIEIHSDSQYLVKGINEWIHGWIKRGWKNSSGGAVANEDLWKFLHNLRFSNKNIHVEFNWVRGHKGKSVTIEQDCNSYFNELCDTYATDAIKQILKNAN